MTIDEAIKILEQERRDHHSFPTDIIGQAEGLGIEGLKRLKSNRGTIYTVSDELLLGETEE